MAVGLTAECPCTALERVVLWRLRLQSKNEICELGLKFLETL